MKLYRACCAGFVALAMFAVSGKASAQVLYDWINPAGGSYHSAVNWFPGAGAPPGPNDGAGFGLAATYTVSISQPTTVGDIYVVNGDVAFEVCPFSTCGLFTASAVEVTGFGSTPQLTLLSGLMSVDTLLVSNGGQLFDDSTATLYSDDITVTGTGSSWTRDGGLTVPPLNAPGAGTLNITSGGHVSNHEGWIGAGPGSDATATVSGAGSTWTNNGNSRIGFISGTGTLIIQDGGQVSALDARIGSDFGNGSVTVSGTGSTWTVHDPTTVNDDISVGHTQGTGTLTVENGAAVVASRFIFVGNGATGTMNITDAGTISSRSGFIGVELGGIAGAGTVTVGGAGAAWNIGGQLSVGGESESGATGTLNIDPGGSVAVAFGSIGVHRDSVLRLHGGTLSASNINVHSDAVFDWTSGTLEIGGFGGNLLNQGGTFFPLPSGFAFNISGSYTQLAAGKLVMDLSSPSTFDRLSIFGNFTLDGTLEIALQAGFSPAAGTTFDILDWNGTQSGTFSTLQLPALAAGLQWDTSQLYTSGMLRVVPTLPGDYNDDGSIDAADYVVWRDNEGTNNVLPNDLIGGMIGPPHYNQWRAHFGEVGGGSGLGMGAVPEPGTVVILLAATGGLFVATSNRRRQ